MLLALLALTACGGSPTPPTPPAVVAVQTTKAKLRTIADVVTTGGSIFPLHQANLSPKISAPVRTFYVERGDRVHRGQLLAVLDNHDLAGAAVASEGAYDQARATYQRTLSSTLPEQIQAAEVAAQNAKASLDAQQKLYESYVYLYEQHAGARKQVDQAKVALTTAQNQYQTATNTLDHLKTTGVADQTNAAKGQLESAHGQFLSAQAQLVYSRLRSPIDGVVADRSVYPGQLATAGVPLITVVDVSKVIVRLHVPQPQAALLKMGDAASIHVPGMKQAVAAKVTVLSPALDPNSTTVEVWVAAPNPGDHLQPGTSVEVSITANTVPDALVVPAASLLNASDGSQAVMVVKPDRHVRRQKVTTGITDNGDVQILSGLRPGEEIVAAGAYGLPDGTEIKSAKTVAPQP